MSGPCLRVIVGPHELCERCEAPGSGECVCGCHETSPEVLLRRLCSVNPGLAARTPSGTGPELGKWLDGLRPVVASVFAGNSALRVGGWHLEVNWLRLERNIRMVRLVLRHDTVRHPSVCDRYDLEGTAPWGPR